MLPDENATNPETEVVPAPKPEPETLLPESDEDSPESEAEGEDEGDAFEDIEYEGKAYKLPKELKDALLRQSDYTKKTQGLAQELEQTKAERTAHAKAAKLHNELFDQRSDLRILDLRLGEFQKVDWAKLEASDPVKAMSLTRRLQQTQYARDQLVKDIDGKEKELSSSQEREFASLWEQGNATLTRKIPNWGTDTAQKLGTFATGELGYTAEQLQRARPGDFYTLHLAQIGAQFLKQSRAPKPAPDAPAVEPVTIIRPRKSPRSNEPSDKDDPDTWLKKRNAQIAARAR